MKLVPETDLVTIFCIPRNFLWQTNNLLAIELKLSVSFIRMFFFVTAVACDIECVGTTEPTNILYVSVKVNLYDQTEY